MSANAAESALLMPEGWGSIEEVVNAPLIDVPADASWCSVFLMWVFTIIPLNPIQGIFGGLCQSIFYIMSVGCCCPGSSTCCSALGSVLAGRPFILAYNWWRYAMAGLIALIANARSRLQLFNWEWEAFGKGRYYWHGEGIWAPRYEDCDQILKSNQKRTSAFGCIQACIPDLFATNILIFLSNDGPQSEWGVIRYALHKTFLDNTDADYRRRLGLLRQQITSDWPTPQITDFDDVSLVQRTVAKSVFWMMFGIWLTEDEASVLTGWRTNAMFFILPRLVQRFAFNLGIKRVKQLRVDTVNIIQNNGLAEQFVKLNKELGVYQRTPVVKLCDEIMYVIGFAGIGGTSACVESVGQFLQNKIPAEAPAALIDFGEYNTPEKMKSAYLADPDAYIRETCRMDPPVTSAGQVLKEAQRTQLGKQEFDLPEGTLNQYVISIANRDETLFPEPGKFNPKRSGLTKALTWNGAFGELGDEKTYPRICPGRYLSLDIAKTIVDHVLTAPNRDVALAGSCC